MTIPASMKRQIMAQLVAITTELNYFATVEGYNIRLLSSDFTDAMLPAIQFIGIGDEITYQRNRMEKSWVIQAQVVMKQTSQGVVTQSDLWDVQEMVEAQLGANLQLDIPHVIDINIRGCVTDLHMEDPYYTFRLEFHVKYHQQFTAQN